MGGVCGSPTPSLSYSFGAMDWHSVYLAFIGLCQKESLIWLQLGRGPSASTEHRPLENCATLNYVVSLEIMEF